MRNDTPYLRVATVTGAPPCGIIKVMSTMHSFQTDDARLRPVYDKVMAGERLNAR